MLIELIIAFIIGGIAGCILMHIRFRPKVGGIINIDRSDSDGPYLFLELTESINDLSAKQYVNFKVKNTNYISPE